MVGQRLTPPKGLKGENAHEAEGARRLPPSASCVTSVAWIAAGRRRGKGPGPGWEEARRQGVQVSGFFASSMRRKFLTETLRSEKRNRHRVAQNPVRKASMEPRETASPLGVLRLRGVGGLGELQRIPPAGRGEEGGVFEGWSGRLPGVGLSAPPSSASSRLSLSTSQAPPP